MYSSNRHDDPIDGSARLGRALEQVWTNASHAAPAPQFERMSVNNAVLTRLMNDLHDADSTLKSVTELDALKVFRGELLNLTTVATNIRFLVWCRQHALKEITADALLSFKKGSIISTAMSTRSVLELIGNASLLEKKIAVISLPTDADESVIEWITDIEEVVDDSLWGMRIDYRRVTEQGLRSNKKIDYKPAAGQRSHEAKDLLKGVDHLGKTVLGARNAYDFLSEFTHPNLASVWSHYDATVPMITIGEIHLYTASHRAGRLGEVFLQNYESVFAEAVEIVADAVTEFHRITMSLNDLAKVTETKSKRIIRQYIKRKPKAFDRAESCPCHSGRNIRYCCGRLINEKKFGRLSDFGAKLWSQAKN